VNPFNLQTALQKALEETWMLRYNGVELQLKVALNEVLEYYPTFSKDLHVKNIYINQEYIFVPDYNKYKGFPAFLFEYLSPLYSFPTDSFKAGIFLSQLFLCEQIDLEPEEYDYFYATIFLKVTNKTIYGASFRDAQIDIFRNSSSLISKSTVRVCIDEFLDHYNRRDFSCLISWSSNLMLFVLFYHIV
jgi:hypothetical protein